jgi:hypothetical protein
MAVRLVFIVVGLLIVACGDSATPSTVARLSGDTSRLVDCAGSRYDPDAFAGAPDPSTLPPGPAGAVDDVGDPAFDASLNWKVVHQSDKRVDLLREVKQARGGRAGEGETHQRVTLERVFGATNIPDGTWMLAASGVCTPRLIADDGLDDADLALARTPSPRDMAVELLVTERECASGQTAEGRVEVRDLQVTDKQVRVWIGVRPPGGSGQTCPSNPPTPFTIELEQAVGTRSVVDIGVLPPRPLTSPRP